ncbi:MAG TPA: BamA/TamA family outer membrane protein [Pyrinomonadaceae bacterium]|nr:BamA/TamA family outer membrane protein [Pyrinomonadaceae bacterium]
MSVCNLFSIIFAGLLFAGVVVGQEILQTEQQIKELRPLLENTAALERLRNQQITTIAHRLKLTPAQLAQARPVLNHDFDEKIALLRNTSDKTSITRELEAINEDTEQQLDQILDDSQMSEFRKLSGRAKEPVPWLLGAVPGMDDRGGSGSVETTSKSRKAKRFEPVIAPIPIINPTLGNGLALGGGFLYHLNKDDLKSPPSFTGGGAFRTSNGSRGFVFAQKLVLKENKYRLLVATGRADIHFDFFGIGADSGDAGVSIPIEVSGRGLLIDGSMRVFRRNWFAGVRYYVMRSTVNVDRSNVTPSSNPRIPGRPEIPEIDLELRTAGLGPTLEFDSRSDSFYPRKGEQFRFQASFNGRAVGGRRTYQTYQTYYNKYMSLAPKHVLAVHASGCQAAGNVPFYDLCFFGQSKDVRGYEVGRYIDRVMIAGQAEYRVELRGRLGAAAFFGAGEVARRWADLRSDALKPGGGVGLRLRITKESHINLRIDYGWGIGSRGLYLGVGEAF